MPTPKPFADTSFQTDNETDTNSSEVLLMIILINYLLVIIMADQTVRAGQIWVRRARRKMRIKLSDRKRYQSYKRALNHKPQGTEKEGTKAPRAYRNEFLTLDARNKLISSQQEVSELRHFTKLEIKERLFAAGVPVPLTYMTVTSIDEVTDSIKFLMRNFRQGFVIKPNDGHSGKGITVINKVVGSRFITIQDAAWESSRLELHLNRILAGRFSRARRDVALVEERIVQHHRLRNIAALGLVDFRLIVSHGYPVMAMARLPTRRSRGKGNLHRGALGMGISLHEGVLTSGVFMDKPRNHHPDTGMLVSGFRVPYWKEILHTGARAQFFSGMKYAGVDMVVDGTGNVKVLEVNRRPGLSIQLANKAGLKSRLEQINALVAGEAAGNDNGFGSLAARVEYTVDRDKDGWKESGGNN
jgi:alpha-L-glutamate ligase-like protein